MLDIILAQLATFGGPVLLALLGVSLLATATTIFKVIQFAQLGIGRFGRAREALVRWHAGDRAGAYEMATADKSQLSAVVASAMLVLGHDPNNVSGARQVATQAALRVLELVSKRLRIIESIVQAAPMLGLLGTVIGMIEAFGKVSEGGGAADPSALAGGIWIALTTTALGLAVAIPFYFVSIWLESRVEGERAAMEAAIAEVTLVR